MRVTCIRLEVILSLRVISVVPGLAETPIIPIVSGETSGSGVISAVRITRVISASAGGPIFISVISVVGAISFRVLGISF